jgi:hypothetical protein
MERPLSRARGHLGSCSLGFRLALSRVEVEDDSGGLGVFDDESL